MVAQRKNPLARSFDTELEKANKQSVPVLPSSPQLHRRDRETRQDSSSPMNHMKQLDMKAKEQRDPSNEMPSRSKTLRHNKSSTSGRSLDYFGIPTTVILSSSSDDTIVSDLSVESFEVVLKKPHCRSLPESSVRAKKNVPRAMSNVDDWPSDEECDVKKSTPKNNTVLEGFPIAEQAAEFFVGDEPFTCDFTSSFRSRPSKARQGRSRRLRKMHSTMNNLCGVVSRDDVEDTTSCTKDFGSSCSSYEDKRDTAPLISDRPRHPYRLV